MIVLDTQRIRFLGYALVLMVVERSTTTLHAQSEAIQFENLSVEHGLSHPNVRAIVQDRLGFMWFGTEDGLNRYDGHTFTVYKHIPQDSNSLSSNSILCLLEDEDSILWIGTNGGGLNALNHRTGKFKRYRVPDGEYIASLCLDHDGILWMGGNLVGLDRVTGRLIGGDTLPSSTFEEVKVVRAIHESKDGTLWIGTWFDGVTRIERDRQQVTVYKHNAHNTASISENHVISVFQDSHSNLWFGTNTGGLNRLDTKGGTFTRFPKGNGRGKGLNDNTVRAIYEDAQGQLWIGTSGGGVNIMNLKTGQMLYLVHSSTTSTSLSGDHVYAIYEDHGGTLWLATDGGISKYARVRYKFTFLPAGTKSLAFPDPLRAICLDRSDHLWVVNYGKGITMVSGDKKSFVYYPHERWTSRSRYGRFVMTIHADRRGFVWFGTYGNGLTRFDRRTNSFKTYRIESSDSSAGGNSVSAIHEDPQGTLWIATGRSIASLDQTHDDLTYYGDYASIKRRDPEVFNVQCILAEPNGTLWLGTQYVGLILYDPSRGVVRRFGHREVDSSSISNNDVRILHKDKHGLWVGTYGGGLNLYNQETEAFEHVTEREGLLSNIIHGIVEDGEGDLWISSPKGVSHFDPKTRAVRNYEAADGLSGLSENSLVCRENGEIICGSSSGLFFFHPKTLRENPHIPNINLTRFDVLNEPFPLPQPLCATQEITLDHAQNFFSFEFAALDFVAPDRNQYAYMLEGLDKDWVKIGTRRRANYTHLDPGKYVFRVKGSNNDGVWNETGTFVTITITPPFWQTWWFRGLAVLSLAGLLTLAYNYRVNKLLEVERVRVRIAQDLHDELGSNLSGIALASRILQEDANLTGEQHRRLSEISRTASDTADAMRELVWFINPEHDRPDNLVLKMRDVAAATLGGIELTFHAQDDVFDRLTDIEVRRHLFLIYKEVLNNIVKHAHCTKVDVCLQREERGFHMSITDDGRGFDLNKKYTGNGLANLRSRAATIGADLRITTSPGYGAEVALDVKTT